MHTKLARNIALSMRAAELSDAPALLHPEEDSWKNIYIKITAIMPIKNLTL